MVLTITAGILTIVTETEGGGGAGRRRRDRTAF